LLTGKSYLIVVWCENRKLESQFSQFLAKEQIDHIVLRDALNRRQITLDEIRYECDGHFNEFGHLVLAEIIADRLRGVDDGSSLETDNDRSHP
ncbi:MAG TPA: hypothetical protein VIY86_05645, partial [Pirellulaceae bacterium]